MSRPKTNKDAETLRQERNERMRRYRARHHDTISQYNKKWVQEHRSERNEYMKAYRKANPDKVKQWEYNRKIKKQGAKHTV